MTEKGHLPGVVSMRDVTGVFGALGAGDSEIDIEHEFDQLVRKRRLTRDPARRPRLGLGQLERERQAVQRVRAGVGGLARPEAPR